MKTMSNYEYGNHGHQVLQAENERNHPACYQCAEVAYGVGLL